MRKSQRPVHSLVVVLGALLSAASIAAADPPGAGPVPRPLPGWSMELVAAAPDLRCPSVVACAPDGRVFVAEDPMDLTRPANVAEGRILCIHPDRRVTVFADGLHAVFGMQYLEGKLYVLHNPNFSVFRADGGRATDREELIAQTNPNPWALDWNDHVPANFKLAMDGRFYVAIGDKGLFGAVGRDGKRVDLHGGGILRLRPDGTELEVFSSGVRNILDVALTDEDEAFTYDNTDENQWMGRVTHMVDGGFYGYPFDFIPRRPYTLWMFADYGAGAATGATVYNGDALPDAYRGNLFLSDFGQRNVRCVALGRDGASFAAHGDRQLFVDPPGDFRPVGIAFSDDGRSLYICDWQHRDTKENAVTGRLWKLSWTGPDASAPRPDWYGDVAAGRATTAGSAEIAGALGHPAFAVRLAAQRELGRRGAAALGVLQPILASGRATVAARIHALWALDAIDGGTAARGDIARAAIDADVRLARQALRQLGNRRAPETKLASSLLAHRDASVRFHAATALGRIGDPAAIAALVDAGAEPDPFARHAVFVALRRIGEANPNAWIRIVGGLRHAEPRVRETCAFALRDVFDAALVDALGMAFGDAAGPVDARVRMLATLAALHHRPPEWNGEWWAYHPFRMTPPARTNDWAGTPRVHAVLATALGDSLPAIRIAAAEGWRQFRGDDAGERLLARHDVESDPAVKAALVSALAIVQPKGAGPLAARLIRETPASNALSDDTVALAKSSRGKDVIDALQAAVGMAPASARGLQCIALLGEPGARDALPLLGQIARDSSTPARAAAARAIGNMAGDGATERLLPLLDDADAAVRVAAIEALAPLKPTNAVPALVRAWADAATRDAASAALARVPDVRAIDVYLDALGSRNAATRAAGRTALGTIRPAALPVLVPRLAGIPPAVIGELQQVFRTDPAAIAAGLMRLDSKRPDRDAFMSFGLGNAGNADHGRALFRDAAGVACIRCHRVQGEGAAVGPDLSGAGAQFDRRALAESILWPSRAVREGYNVVELELNDGDAMSGMIRGETTESISLQPAAGDPVVVPKSRVKSRTPTALSLMPEGLEGGLSLEDFADLLAYLQSLRSGT